MACSMGNCVKVIHLPCGATILYSTRRPDEAVLVDADEWVAFVADVKAGQHDDHHQPAALAALDGDQHGRPVRP